MEHLNDIQVTTVTKSKNSLLSGMFINTSFGRTENNALTYTRSGSSLLDFFAQAGAMRGNPEQALKLFKKAFAEDRQTAVRILFYLRDVRGGQGERDLFRHCLAWLGTDVSEVFNKVVGYVPEYGRWDDLFFNNDQAFAVIKRQFEMDIKSEEPSLLAKWLPTANASSIKTRAKAKIVAEKLGLNLIDYRKKVRAIRKKLKVVEEKMSARNWKEIEYAKVPSQAAGIYKDAFEKHDEKRYNKYLEKVEEGKEKINAKTLYPYQIYKSAQDDYSKTLEVLWNALPDYTQGRNALVIADTSGSMSGDPMSVSVSLALYFAERNKGQFKDYFISFTENPKLHKIQGRTLLDKMNSIQLGDVANTDLQRVFVLILGTALQNNTPEEEMPSTLYIISDMEFDEATTGTTNYEEIKDRYSEAGYKLPNIVFWNVNSSSSNLPVRYDEHNVAMVSGFSPVAFKIATSGKTPEEVMLDTVNSERYSNIVL